MKTRSKGRNNAKVFVIIAVVAVVIAVGVIAVVASQMAKKQEAGNTVQESGAQVNQDVLNRGFVEDEKEAEAIVDNMQDKVEEGMFSCKMTMTWTFEDGTSEAPNAYVANSELNKHTFYFDVVLDDTDEVVYSSPLVPVGSEIYGITLDKDLDAGEYPMTVVYTLVDENYQEISTVGFSITAIVRN